MPGYAAPVDDIQFILHGLLDVSRQDIPGYGELEPDLTAAVLTEAGRIAAEVLAPLNAAGDREGCRLEGGAVRTPAGFRAAFDEVKAGGWTALDCDPDYGGQGMPGLIGSAVSGIFSAANQSFTMYQGLTHGAYSAIHAHGSAEQKARFLPRLISCDWTGTMNLTEAQCGTDLGLMRCKAVPQPDGSYRITGEKIFISAGDHDLAENIIHLVLARIAGAPEGIGGISLFIVPKFLVGEEGTLGARNGVSVGKIERKMGIHGNATCLMRYEGAQGWLLGLEHKGMRAMFTMMNEARLGVAMQGLAQAEAACQAAVAYARERLQGRAATGPANPQGPADPLIVHPDIRRSLMDQRSFIEGARAFALWSAMLLDRAQRAGDGDAEGLISLLIPVLKGFLTDKGLEMTVQAQQVFGGHGYIEETGMSQFLRDARITQIYEGANGVQALDLVARKLPSDGGRHMAAFLGQVSAFIADNGGDAALAQDFLAPLGRALADLQAAVRYFMERGAAEPETVLAGSTDFLHLFGHTCLGFMWARMAKVAQTAETGFREAKLATGRYYMARQLPATALHLARIRSGAGPVMALPAEAF
ncbi:MAG: acyl-CoA dehydrogenase C-terminal domain-containing protein [Tropicimonas sp.]|uniref:acyl-CoA dehydrogenase C-terminal domain-containing protein n=1 Tax=Tropicimonas sp. TaxID=2067044 RepID=UPI003A88CCF4